MAVPVWEGWKVWKMGVSDLCPWLTVGFDPLMSLSAFTACQEPGWPRLAAASTQSHYSAFLSAPTLSVSPALCLTHLSFGFSLLPFRVSRTLSFLCPTFCRRVFLCSQPLALCVCITVFLFFCLWASGSSWPCLALICPHLLEPRSSLLKG